MDGLPEGIYRKKIPNRLHRPNPYTPKLQQNKYLKELFENSNLKIMLIFLKEVKLSDKSLTLKVRWGLYRNKYY